LIITILSIDIIVKLLKRIEKPVIHKNPGNDLNAPSLCKEPSHINVPIQWLASVLDTFITQYTISY
jgi:hypothetical protein